LHRIIWNIANDLRGSVDGWDFKQYILGMLFYRYISENLSAYIDDGEHAAGDTAFRYAALTTYNLCRINMLLHDIDYDKFDVALGDTLIDPIVGILDRFEVLTNDITSGLPAEIEVRKKHYEYYRDKLLRFNKYIN